MLGSCCLQHFPCSSGWFGSKKQLLGAPGAELAVGMEEGRLGACKAVSSSGHPLPGASAPKASGEGALGGPKPRGWQQGRTPMAPACSPATKLRLDPSTRQEAPARLATAMLRLGRTCGRPTGGSRMRRSSRSRSAAAPGLSPWHAALQRGGRGGLAPLPVSEEEGEARLQLQ